MEVIMAQMWTRRAELPSSIPRPGLGTANTEVKFVNLRHVSNYPLRRGNTAGGLSPELCQRKRAVMGFDVDSQRPSDGTVWSMIH